MKPSQWLAILVLIPCLLGFIGAQQKIKLQLYSTGFSEDGKLLAHEFGSSNLDPHYEIVGIEPSRTSYLDNDTHLPDRGSLPVQAYIIENPESVPTRVPCNSDCNWIGFINDPLRKLPTNLYHYKTKFDIPPGTSLESVKISLKLSVDNRLHKIFLNGKDMGIPDIGSASRWIPFHFMGTDHDFVYGENSLVFVIHSTLRASGLAVKVEEALVEAVKTLDEKQREEWLENLRRKKYAPRIMGMRADPTACEPFEVVDINQLPEGYTDLSDAGMPGIILSPEGRVVLTNPNPNSADLNGFSTIQGMSFSSYGAPLCVTVIDCAAVGMGTIGATVENTLSLQQVAFALYEVCSNPGIFFGCVNTEYVPSGGLTIDNTAIGGDFGDELVVRYNSLRSLPDPLTGELVNTFSRSAWLGCREGKNWPFSIISNELWKDKLMRTKERLVKMKTKLEVLKGMLFETPELECHDIGRKYDLVPGALGTHDFADCLVAREEDAEALLGLLRAK